MIKNQFQLDRSIVELQFDELNGHVLFGSYSQLDYNPPKFFHKLRHTFGIEVPIQSFSYQNNFFKYDEENRKKKSSDKKRDTIYKFWDLPVNPDTETQTGPLYATIDTFSSVNILTPEIYQKLIASITQNQKFMALVDKYRDHTLRPNEISALNPSPTQPSQKRPPLNA